MAKVPRNPGNWELQQQTDELVEWVLDERHEDDLIALFTLGKFEFRGKEEGVWIPEITVLRRGEPIGELPLDRDFLESEFDEAVRFSERVMETTYETMQEIMNDAFIFESRGGKIEEVRQKLGEQGKNIDLSKAKTKEEMAKMIQRGLEGMSIFPSNIIVEEPSSSRSPCPSWAVVAEGGPPEWALDMSMSNNWGPFVGINSSDFFLEPYNSFILCIAD